MAQKGQSLLFVCSRCRHQLTKKSPRAARTFASTAPRSRSIPSFSPTSSPELDALFLSFRERVFTPYALAQHHRDLIYKKSRHPVLLNDPGVTVTLSNDEEVRLMPAEPRERPNKRKSLNQIAKILSESSDAGDWGNLPAFLEGMQMAKDKLPPYWLGKIARKANMTGKTGVIKLCAEMVKKTGVTLSNPEMTRELMLGYHLQAVKGSFTGEALEKALRSAEQVSLMMEDKLHCAGKLKPEQVDMRKDPAVLGVLLELAAYKAVNINGGEDSNGKVASLVTKILARTKDESWAVPSHDNPTAARTESWVPIWNAMRTALGIKSIAEGSTATSLRSVKDKLEQALHGVPKIMDASSQPRSTRLLSMMAELEPRAS